MNALIPIQNQFRVNNPFFSQAVAFRASPERVVKGKHPRAQFAQAESAVRAGEIPAEQLVLFGAILSQHPDNDQSFTEFEGQFQGLGQTAPYAVFDNQAVDHRADVVFFIFFQYDLFIRGVFIAIHDNPDKAVSKQVLQELFVLAFLGLDHRRQDLETRSRGHDQEAVYNLIHGLALDRLMAMRAMRPAYPGIHQAQVIVHLGNRPHR